MYMTSEIYQTHIKGIEFLYPHRYDCLAIVVPTSRPIDSFILKIFASNTLKTIIAAFLFLVVMRIIMLRSFYHRWLNDFFITWSILLMENFIRKPRIQLLNICGFC